MDKLKELLDDRDLKTLAGLEALEKGEVISELVREILNHDITYSYSDCSSAWRAGYENENRLLAKIDESDTKDKLILRRAVLTMAGHDALHQQYPSFCLRGDRSYYMARNDHLGLYLRVQKSGVSVQNELDTLSRLLQGFKPILEQRDFRYGLVKTPSAPQLERDIEDRISVNEKTYKLVQELYEAVKEPTVREIVKSLGYLKFKDSNDVPFLLRFYINDSRLWVQYGSNAIGFYIS